MGHENVADVAVFGVDDEKFGQRLKAVIVKKGSLSEKDVQDYVKKNLAGYKAPRDVVFVDELPRTSTGKVLKRELKDAVLICKRHASAHGPLRYRAPRAHLRRRPAPGPVRRTSTRSTTAARATRSSRSSCPCAWTSPAPPATAGRCGCASRPTLDGPCMRCLENADADVRGRLLRGPPAGRGGAELLSPYMDDELDLEAWARDALALALPAQLTCRPDCAGLCPAAARTSTRTRRTPTSAEPDPRWAQALRAEVRLRRSLPFSRRYGRP